MLLTLVVKANSDAGAKLYASLRGLPNCTVTRSYCPRRRDVVLELAHATGDDNHRAIDWFCADGPSMPPLGFPVGSLLWHGTTREEG